LLDSSNLKVDITDLSLWKSRYWKSLALSCSVKAESQLILLLFCFILAEVKV
jgi:hypothetical protein